MVLNAQVRNYPLQPGVLFLQRSEPPRFVDLHPSVFTLPHVICRGADIVRRAHRLHRTPRLRFPQYPDDLLFTESTLFHFVLLRFFFEQNSSYVTSTFLGSGHADLSEIGKWYRQQLAIAKAQRRSKAPDQWRTDRIVAVKTAMKAIGKSKDDYYPELSDRLNMKRPFTSLTKLTKTDLERVYRLVLSDARKTR